jgi:hypothetical protein
MGTTVSQSRGDRLARGLPPAASLLDVMREWWHAAPVSVVRLPSLLTALRERPFGQYQDGAGGEALLKTKMS